MADISKPILVIGGGISGVTTAVEAAEAGAKVVLVEPSKELHPVLVSINLHVLFEIINLGDAAVRDALLFG